MLASNGFVAVLRLGLADELDGLHGDLAAMVRPLEALGSKPEKPDEPLAEIRAQLLIAARRTAAIKARYANTSAEDNLLRHMLRDRLTKQSRSDFAGTADSAGAPYKGLRFLDCTFDHRGAVAAQPSSTSPDDSKTDATEKQRDIETLTG